MPNPTTQPTNTGPGNTITAMQLRRGSSKVLDKVFYRRQSFVIEKAGEPRAAIVPLAEYQDMKRRRAEAKKRLFVKIDKLRAAFANEDPKEVGVCLTNQYG